MFYEIQLRNKVFPSVRALYQALVEHNKTDSDWAQVHRALSAHTTAHSPGASGASTPRRRVRFQVDKHSPDRGGKEGGEKNAEAPSPLLLMNSRLSSEYWNSAITSHVIDSWKSPFYLIRSMFYFGLLSIIDEPANVIRVVTYSSLKPIPSQVANTYIILNSVNDLTNHATGVELAALPVTPGIATPKDGAVFQVDDADKGDAGGGNLVRPRIHVAAFETVLLERAMDVSNELGAVVGDCMSFTVSFVS